MLLDDVAVAPSGASFSVTDLVTTCKYETAAFCVILQLGVLGKNRIDKGDLHSFLLFAE
jgi:hypothetical protein